jgi:hypothetical protein
MHLPTLHDPDFAPGFRLSWRDAIVLAIGSAAALALASVVWWWGFVVAFVLGHFFLFCNVIRMARALELAWTAVFVVLASASILTGLPGWRVTAAGSLLTTAVLVAVQMRRPSYHGLGWERINPGLPAWWETHRARDRAA